MPKLLIATENKGKRRELQELLSSLPGIELVLPSELGINLKVEETGSTYAGNAILKANAYCEASGMVTVADDSGLEVYALNNAPGVLSSRYSGEGANDGKNIEKLLHEMRPLSDEERKARFVCCLALVYPDGKIEIFTGHVEGRIGREPRGSHGFGYDPLFYPEGYGKTFAEMKAKEKDSLSHRGNALREFQKYLRRIFK